MPVVIHAAKDRPSMSGLPTTCGRITTNSVGKPSAKNA
jgi:hypothetical protein